MPSNDLILSPPSPPAFNLSQHQGLFKCQFFSSGGQNIGASASASVIPMDTGLIFFRIDWFDLLEAQGTFKSLLQHHSSKASVLRHSAFFMVQLSHPYMTSGKTIALIRQTFVSKAMSLLFNMLSRFVRVFLSMSECLLISRLSHHPH